MRDFVSNILVDISYFVCNADIKRGFKTFCSWLKHSKPEIGKNSQKLIKNHKKQIFWGF